MACTQRRAPFRSRRWCCLSNRRLARNRFQVRTQSDPCISSVATAIMITTSNSSVKRSRTPNQLLGVRLHTIAIFGLSRVSVWACGPLNLMKIGSSKCRIGQARSGEIEFALEKLRLSACLIRSVRG